MNPERWAEIQELYARALETKGPERIRFLDDLRARDSGLCVEVERLLSTESVASSFLEPPAFASSVDMVGRRLGPFELRAELGRGGMGVVYRAHDSRLDRDVALKVLMVRPTTTQTQVDRFRREARAAAKLNHKSIVPILDVGEDGGLHFFAMELVPTGDLMHELRAQRALTSGVGAPRLPAPGSRNHVSTVANLIAEVAEALQYAHDHGIVHRDVKPQNLLLTPDGCLRLVDFGLAKDESQGSLTKSGDVAGTPHYMSPEQAAARHREIDHRTDVYSLGVVLYEMLSLERPFSGRTTEEVISKILRFDAPPVRQLNRRVPRDLETICSKAMARSPGDRYATAGDFAADLRRLLAFEAIHARPPSLARRTVRAIVRHRLSVVTVLLLGAAGVIGAWVQDRASVSRARTEALAPLLRLAETPGLLEAQDGFVQDVRASLATLGDLDGLSSSQLELVDVSHALLETFRRDVIERVQALLIEDRGAQPTGAIGAVDAGARFRAVRLAARARGWFPQDPELQALTADHMFLPLVEVELTLDGAPGRGEVSCRRLDQLDGTPGELELLGGTDDSPFALEPGYVRIIVEPDGLEHREFTRVIDRVSSPVRVTCSVVSGLDPMEGMLRVPAGTVTIPRDSKGSAPHPYTGRPVAVDEFFVDPFEMTVAKYRAYCSVSGVSLPEFWSAFPTDGSVDQLPATGMSWFEARACAEWYGCRLISVIEWEYAARGPFGSDFPYATNPADPTWIGANDGDREGLDGPEDLVRLFRAYARPVGSFPDASWCGLRDTLGNALEWSESVAYDWNDDGELIVRSESRAVMGPGLLARVDRDTLGIAQIRGPTRSHADALVGFRCARSVNP